MHLGKYNVITSKKYLIFLSRKKQFILNKPTWELFDTCWIQHVSWKFMPLRHRINHVLSSYKFYFNICPTSTYCVLLILNKSIAWTDHHTLASCPLHYALPCFSTLEKLFRSTLCNSGIIPGSYWLGGPNMVAGIEPRSVKWKKHHTNCIIALSSQKGTLKHKPINPEPIY